MNGEQKTVTLSLAKHNTDETKIKAQYLCFWKVNIGKKKKNATHRCT